MLCFVMAFGVQIDTVKRGVDQAFDIIRTTLHVAFGNKYFMHFYAGR